MSLLAKQFGGPSGPLGHAVTRLLARGNRAFNRWIVHELAAEMPAPTTIIEVGCGPGIALQELHRVFPTARIVGVDPSDVVRSNARRRNAAAIGDGRVTLVGGDVTAITAYPPADLVLAVHVIYFWSDPAKELRRIHDSMTPGGRVGLGYQLRAHMPRPAQRNFPKAGFTLYDSDDQIAAHLHHAGFDQPHVKLLGNPESPSGRLIVATS